MDVGRQPRRGNPGRVPELVRLPDGGPVEIRPIAPGDRQALAAMYADISVESRYRRFLAVHPELGENELTYLTEIDHHDHEALVAFAAGDGPMVGVVRYVRTHDDEAEPAMLITDSWQGRGLVTVMLERLVRIAWAEGVRRFRASVLADNPASLRSLDRLGSSVHHLVGAEIEVEVTLRPPTEGATSRPGRGRPPLTGRTLLADLAPRREPPPAVERTDTIVVGVGDERGADAIVAAAVRLAEPLGASLLLVRACRDDKLGEAIKGLERLAMTARANGIEVETSVRRVTAAAAIVDACAESGALMAVLGPTGRRREAGSGALIGAVADVVARQAPCDVLLLNL